LKNQHWINRREFLVRTAGLAALAACPRLLPACGGDVPNPMPVAGEGVSSHKAASAWVPLGQEEGSYDLFRAAVEAATDFSWLGRGDRVFLKLALNSGNPFPATTDPWALECMVRLLRERGAGEIVAGDQSGVEHVFHTPIGGRGSSRACCRASGLLDVMEVRAVTPCFFEERGYEAYRGTLPSEPHHWEQPICVTTALDDVEHIVYLPRVANHFLAGKTFGIKIAIGFLRDDSRVFFHTHFGTFQEMYEEINQVPEIAARLRLTVTSGRALMTTAGPDRGEIVRPEHGLVFASEDLLAHDLLAAAWLEANRMETVPEDIYAHPAIRNRLDRIGGLPGGVQWIRVNEHPDPLVTVTMQDLLEPGREPG